MTNKTKDKTYNMSIVDLIPIKIWTYKFIISWISGIYRRNPVKLKTNICLYLFLFTFIYNYIKPLMNYYS